MPNKTAGWFYRSRFVPLLITAPAYILLAILEFGYHYKIKNDSLPHPLWTAEVLVFLSFFYLKIAQWQRGDENNSAYDYLREMQKKQRGNVKTEEDKLHPELALKKQKSVLVNDILYVSIRPTFFLVLMDLIVVEEIVRETLRVGFGWKGFFLALPFAVFFAGLTVYYFHLIHKKITALRLLNKKLRSLTAPNHS